MSGGEAEVDDTLDPIALDEEEARQAQGVANKVAKPKLPIFSILGSIDFSDHFVIIGDVGTGKSTVTPVHEFELTGRTRRMIIREPSRAACSALYYSLQALHPEVKDEFAVITKDTKINIGGKIEIVTDGVLLRMLAEESVVNSSIYFDESHQMSSQLELCLSLAKKEEARAGNLFRVMSATIDPNEFLSFLGISRLYHLSGRRFPVSINVDLARDVAGMFAKLALNLNTQPRGESWLVFLPTRRLVEKYASGYGGIYIHGGLEGSEINKIQERAEIDRNLRVFATNVIASSVNIYVDNVLIFIEVIDGKEKFGRKTLHYKKIDNNSLLQMIGRVGRFKPGRAVIVSDIPVPRKIAPVPVRKALETETPFDLVLLMSKYGLKLSELEFMSKVNHREVAFAEEWLTDIGAIDRQTHAITQKGLLMSEIPYDPDFAHMISSALLAGDYEMARFLLASGAFGDSLNHAWRSEMEGVAKQFLYAFDKSSELNIKALLLKKYLEDKEGAFVSRLIGLGIYVGFVEEAYKSYQAAREALNDVLVASGKETMPAEVVVNPDVSRLRAYLEDSLSFERFELHQKREFNLHDMEIEGPFFARTLTINYRRILFDIVALNSYGRNHGRGR